jgi:hypothetical protein
VIAPPFACGTDRKIFGDYGFYDTTIRGYSQPHALDCGGGAITASAL